MKTKNQTKLGLMLWSIVLLGYFIFVVNWVLMNQLQGSIKDGNGWIDKFFTENPSAVTVQAINYTITAMRGIGAVLAGWLLVKIGHKYSVLIALALLSIALPTVFLPNYGLFIAGRMLMAVGGTVLIVYTQPIISNFFKNKRTRGKLSLVNSIGFNLGAALPIIPFMIPSVATTLRENWQLTAGIVAGIPIIILGIYSFFGVQFNQNVLSDNLQNEEHKEKISFFSVLKEKNTWKMIAYFSAWLIVVVVPILVINPKKIAIMSLAETGTVWASWEILLPVVLFLLGVFLGFFVIGWINKTDIDRRWYISICSFLGLTFLMLSFITEIFMTNIALSAIFAFLSGTFLWGIQGVVLNLPHEFKGNTPKKIGIIFGLTWGIGYLIYTLGNILLAGVYDAIGHTSFGLAWAIVVFVIICLPIIFVPIFFPKTKEKKLSSIFIKSKK